jgi:uncharacterized delta-60 repeat protein
MKISMLFSASIFLVGHAVSGQQFATRFNGAGNGIDALSAMVVDNSGNMYVTGSSFSGANGDDYVTIKYNAAGVQQWLARYNGPGNGSDVPSAIFVDISGNVYVTGYSDQLTGYFINNDAATVKYNAQGAQLWVARFDGLRQRADGGNAVKVDAAGNVFVTGFTTVNNGAYTKMDYLTVKYNSAGTVIWTATYNGPANQDDAAVGLGLDGSGNCYVTGTSFAGRDPLGEQDYLTIKYNASGVQQWTARFNGPLSEPDRAVGIVVDPQGNSVVTGYSQGINLDYATVKYNSSGIQQWVTRYNGAANGSDIPSSIALDNAGNIYVTGEDQAVLYNSDFRTIKYNSAGVQQWTARLNGPANDNDEAYALAVDGSGNVYVTGYMNGTSPSWNIATVKYNASGAQLWVKTYDGPGHGNDHGAAIAVDGSGNVYIAGTSMGTISDLDFVAIKYNSAGLRMAAPAISLKSSFNASPNPVSNTLKVQLPGNDEFALSLTTIAGEKVLTRTKGRGQVMLDFNQLPAGVYLLTAVGNKDCFVQKIVKE